MTPAEVVIGAGALWLLKQILGPLISEQVTGSVPDYTAEKVRAAARLLPHELAEEYEQDWLAELETLKGKPLSALKYALGLRRAAKGISSRPARSRFRFIEIRRRRAPVRERSGARMWAGFERASDYTAQEPSPLWGLAFVASTLAVSGLVSLFVGPVHGIALIASVVISMLPPLGAFLRHESAHRGEKRPPEEWRKAHSRQGD